MGEKQKLKLNIGEDRSDRSRPVADADMTWMVRSGDEQHREKFEICEREMARGRVEGKDEKRYRYFSIVFETEFI